MTDRINHSDDPSHPDILPSADRLTGSVATPAVDREWAPNPSGAAGVAADLTEHDARAQLAHVTLMLRGLLETMEAGAGDLLEEIEEAEYQRRLVGELRRELLEVRQEREVYRRRLGFVEMSESALRVKNRDLKERIEDLRHAHRLRTEQLDDLRASLDDDEVQS